MRRLLPKLVVLALLMGSLLVAGCGFSVSPEEPAQPATGESGLTPQQSQTLAPEALSPQVYEERRRALPGGGFETHNGPIQRLDPVDTAQVGHGEIVIELRIPENADEQQVRSALHLYPEDAVLHWLRDGTLEVRWPGGVYEGVTLVGADQLPVNYSLRIAPRTPIGPELILGGGVNITVTRTAEPLYTVVDVEDETVRTPYERPRHGYDLTQKEHVFELHFTRPMDMDSVAEALDGQLGCDGVTRFSALDNQTARYTVLSEPRRSCTINPDGAADTEGLPVWFGMPLRYTIVSPVELLTGSIRFDGGAPDRELRSVAEFDPGRRISAVLGQEGVAIAFEAGYDDEVSGPASYLPWVYHFDRKGNVTSSIDLSSELGFVLDVLARPGAAEVLFRKPGEIVGYGVGGEGTGGTEGPALEDVFRAPAKCRIFGYELAPDGDRLAVLYGPMTDANNRPLDIAVVDLSQPEAEPAVFDGVGDLSPEDWTYGGEFDLAWSEATGEIAFVTYMKQQYLLALLDPDSGSTRVLMDAPQLERAPLLDNPGSASILGIDIEGRPILVDTEQGRAEQLELDFGDEVKEADVNGNLVCFQVGDRIVVYNLAAGESVELPGNLVGWERDTGNLLLYRWK